MIVCEWMANELCAEAIKFFKGGRIEIFNGYDELLARGDLATPPFNHPVMGVMKLNQPVDSVKFDLVQDRPYKAVLFSKTGERGLSVTAGYQSDVIAPELLVESLDPLEVSLFFSAHHGIVPDEKC